MLDRLSSYFTQKLPLGFTPAELFSFMAAGFCFMALSVVVLHAFIPSPQPVLSVLLHALGVASTYTVAFVVVAVCIYVFQFAGATAQLGVWQIWALSFVAYIAGFYLSPISDLVTGSVKYELHADLNEANATFHFLRLTPVWALITYVFISVLQKRNLQQELTQLFAINSQLQDRPRHSQATKAIDFSSGKKVTSIPANQISHISVDDHYCYVHFTEKGSTAAKVDVSGPLTRIEHLLPDYFIKVHRSHIVNLDKILNVEKLERNYALLLADEYRIPISRSRLQQVLPKLQTFLDH